MRTHYHAATVVTDAIVCINDELGARTTREVEALGLGDVVPLVISAFGAVRRVQIVEALSLTKGYSGRLLLDVHRIADDGECGERCSSLFFDIHS